MASILQLLLANEIPLYAAEIASSPPEELVTTLQKLFFLFAIEKFRHSS
jgi:hypothetical protein